MDVLPWTLSSCGLDTKSPSSGARCISLLAYVTIVVWESGSQSSRGGVHILHRKCRWLTALEEQDRDNTFDIRISSMFLGSQEVSVSES
ncbi:hypothetical protein TREES_T100010895 [Tupaia chinensis]|uniref:Uncharacterized protein n=1 Tax=Tupaia chinensis TaxID=246437 RepID=L9JRV5_TUPCH|nr:hypothetical protein TREES_T100010895 [Tupaia chinensis]